MSKVITMQQVLSDCEILKVSKKDMDEKINALKTRIIDLTNENKEKTASEKSNNKNIASYTKALNLLKADRDTIKQKLDEALKTIELLKKDSKKPTQKITGFENLFENEIDKEKGIEDIYNKKYQKKDDELDVYLMNFIK